MGATSTERETEHGGGGDIDVEKHKVNDRRREWLSNDETQRLSKQNERNASVCLIFHAGKSGVLVDLS